MEWNRPLASKLADVRSFFAEITDFIGFGPEDSAQLRAFLPVAEPHLERISKYFCARILGHPQTAQILIGGPEQLDRLEHTVVEWLRSGLAGPHDEAFYVRRARVGHPHVHIGLPQRFMITAMTVLRLAFSELAHETYNQSDPARLAQLLPSLQRLFVLELALMLETYKSEADDRLRRRERLATIGQLAASVGHDLRNPLSVIESSLFILRRRLVDDERSVKHIDKISNQVHDCEHLISNLLDMARDSSPRRSRIRPSDLLDAALVSARVPAHFEIVREGLDGLELRLDGGLLKQALVNLLLNSVQAQSDERGWIRVCARVDGSNATLSVADRGPGFDVDALPLVFEPLVTTKATGTGLGLAVVKNVAERHGGSARADNSAQGGAEVSMYLPDAIFSQK
jgi:two-component system sensor histidine kinase HydH